MTEYRMTITDDAAASMAASILDRKKQQVEVINGVIKDMTVLEDSHKNGTATVSYTLGALDEMVDILRYVASELAKEA